MGMIPSCYNWLVPLALIVSLFFAYGCTKEESDEFNKAIMEGIKQQAINTVTGKGNTSISVEVNKPGAECRFDSDCPSLCEGGVFWKRGCDAQTDKCVKTFDTDCSQQMTAIGNDTFPKLCTTGGCVDDTGAISARKSELVASANDYTAQMQQTTGLRQTAANNCISALADVTDKLIIDTALTFGRLPTSATSIYSATTRQTINTLGKAASGTTKMSAEEFISLNCNAIKALDTDYSLLSKKRDIVMAQAENYQGR